MVGVKNTQGINSPAVRLIAALCARNVVVYGGRVRDIRFNIFLSPVHHTPVTYYPPRGPSRVASLPA